MVPDDGLDAQERRDFRAWVRAHHPDAGGDSAAFAAGLTAWRRRRGAVVLGPVEAHRFNDFGRLRIPQDRPTFAGFRRPSGQRDE
jgi:hypothetical protein